MRNIVKLIAIILVGFILFAGCSSNSADDNTDDAIKNGGKDKKDTTSYKEMENRPEEKAEIGYTAPDFSVELLSGETVKLSDYRGRAVLLNFWTTWCGSCVREMPEIQKLAEAYEDDLVVLAINCLEEKNLVDGFITEQNYTFNVGLDLAGKIEDKYPMKGIPYTLIIDVNGIITKTYLGANTFSDFEGAVLAALGR